MNVERIRKEIDLEFNADADAGKAHCDTYASLQEIIDHCEDAMELLDNNDDEESGDEVE